MKPAKYYLVTALAGVLACGIGLLVASDTAFAHCDTLDGPVAADAKAALEKGNVSDVLKWVEKGHEEEIVAVFKKVQAARKRGPDAREVADLYFLETLVRLHRAGEGAPYTGLKPAGTVEPGVAAADKAIEDSSVAELAAHLGRAVEKSVRERFERVVATKSHKDDSVEAGREYVAAYIEFIHYVENLHDTIAGGGAHHEHEGEAKSEAHDR